MFTHFIFWLWFCGLVCLATGLVVIWKPLVAARGLGKLIVLGPLFVAAPLAVFGAEHFVDARDIMQIVPAWLPARLFITYFVGCALFCAAASFAASKFVRLSATLLGVMFFLFVVMMDIPGVMSDPRNRISWSLMLRESTYATGAWALAGSLMPARQSSMRHWMILLGRFVLAIAAIFYGVEQLIFPSFAPGVPDTKLTATWIPLHAFLGYPVGAILLVAGLALLLNKRPRIAAALIGLVMTLLTVFLYLPILAVTHDPSQMTEAINFVADTLLYGGTALLVAGALPADQG